MNTGALPPWAESYSFTAWTQGSTVHHIGKCRVCKHAVRVAVTQHKQLKYKHGLHREELTFAYQYTTSRPCQQYKVQGQITWATTCVLCEHLVGLKRIDGYLNDGKSCDKRCTGATGQVCECNCAGENHGSDHAA